jgi:hypothetical protein
MNPIDDCCRQTRREFFTSAAGGIGGLALAAMLAEEASGRETKNPLAPRAPHFSPRAKNCIFFFLSGGTSQLDLFDPKPQVNKLAGQPMPESLLKEARFAFIQKDSARILPSPRTFSKHGQSGLEFCDLLPRIATCADDICMIRSMYTQPFNHHPATVMLNSGFERMGRPSIGSWLLYGLGNESKNLPGYVVLEPGPGIRGGATNWSSGFLPSHFAATQFHLQGEPVKSLTTPANVSSAVQRMTLDMIAELNHHRFRHLGDSEIESRVASYELAYRMQSSAPELNDLSSEDAKTLEDYGVNRKGKASDFSRSTLLARRLVERGTRFVQIFMDGWDHHDGIDGGLQSNCDVVDRPIAALIADLKRRGLLDSTLVVWGTEFGRTPLGDNRIGMTTVTGRDHHPGAFTLWMAGGGVRGGHVHGETDEIGWSIVRDPVHINDFHATLLHLFGLNHEALTYRFEGRDFRLTDVAGKVIRSLLA